MTSLRRRLTISYTVLVGAFMSVVAIVLTWVAFDVVVRPIGSSIAAAAAGARAIVAAEPQIPPDILALRVRGLVAQTGVVVFAMHQPRGGPLQRQPPPGQPPEVPLQDGGPPPRGFPAEGFPPPGGLGPEGSNRLLDSFFGIHAEFVRVGGTQLAIVPDRAWLEMRAQTYLLILGIVLVLAIVAAWLIARWIAAHAVAPLIAVTAELRRFAGGDFAPRSLPAGRASDVGALIEAYNGAAAQVAAAFDERELAEGRMRRFLADAGHEMRTPLTIVTAYLDVLRRGIDDAGVRAQAFATLATEMKRMRRLVDRLVALARLEQPETTQPVVVDVGVLARDAVAAIVAARPGDVSCEVESGTFVLADPADLHEAIANLVDNAVKYGAGSLVRVMVEHERGTVVVRVSDCGPGIAPAEREKIFERFYRGAGQGEVEGSGLGLAIAARAATRAGGALTLEHSEPYETVFAVRLPLHMVASLA